MELTRQKQHGFSLIEMMVALLIGLFLMGGVISVYVSSSQSSKVNEGLRTIQENGRYALMTLRESIQMAGYVSSYDPSVIITPFVSAGTGDNKVAVTFEGNLDCEGEAVTATFVENTYSIKNGNLICNGNGDVDDDNVVIDGVEALRVLYGVDDDNDKIADRYLTATDINAKSSAANIWRDDVSSIRIGLLMNSGTSVKHAAESKAYKLLGESITKNDRLLHKVFTTTILLRNRTS